MSEVRPRPYFTDFSFEGRKEIIRTVKGVSNILKMSEWERSPGIGYGTLGGYLEAIKSGLSYSIDWRLFPHPNGYI